MPIRGKNEERKPGLSGSRHCTHREATCVTEVNRQPPTANPSVYGTSTIPVRTMRSVDAFRARAWLMMVEVGSMIISPYKSRTSSRTRVQTRSALRANGQRIFRNDLSGLRYQLKDVSGRLGGRKNKSLGLTETSFKLI